MTRPFTQITLSDIENDFVQSSDWSEHNKPLIVFTGVSRIIIFMRTNLNVTLELVFVAAKKELSECHFGISLCGC